MASFVFFQDLNLPPFPESPTSFTQPPIMVPNLETNLETFHESMSDPRFSESHRCRNEDSGPLDSLSSERNRGFGPLNPLSGGILLVKEQDYLPTQIEDSRFIERRSSELVRINNLTPEERRSSREEVRRMRMTFESLRISVSSEEEERIKRSSETWRHPVPADLNAASTMRGKGLWQNRDRRVVGSIPGVEIGDVFFYRMELCILGLHGQVQSGIDFLPAIQSATGEPIATSIIVSGGYEDNQDHGDTIIYTGHGGKKTRSNKQGSNQKMKGGNLALQKSLHYGVEIRVIRGFPYPESRTAKVYVYDGLYRITKSWSEIGKSGFLVYKFRLVRDQNQGPTGTSVIKLAESIRDAPLSARRCITEGILRLNHLNDLFNEVTLFNDIDNDDGPMHYQYISTPLAYSRINLDVDDEDGCGCVDGCFDGCACSWKNGGEYAYDVKGVLIRGKPLIYECGSSCMCPETCRNRMSQSHVSPNKFKKRFEVFRSSETGGWGVRSLDLIRPGHFICEYAGLVMTREEARVMSMNRDVKLIDGNLFGNKWKEWGNLSKVRNDYLAPSYPPSPPMDFVIDLSEFRNFACYMRHGNRSDVANVMVQKVVYKDEGFCYPHFSLFAMENIPPMRELILDYVNV